MLWIVLGLACALFKATLGACNKHALSGVPKERFGDFHAGHLLLLVVSFAATAAGVAPFLLVEGVPDVTSDFWNTVAFMLFLEVVAQALTTISLSIEDVSVVESFMPVNLVFVGFSSWLFLGEIPTMVGGLGTVCIIGGAIWLVFPRKARRPHLSAVLLRLTALLCFGFIAPNMKHAIQCSSPYFFGFVYCCLFAGVNTAVLIVWCAARSHQRNAVRAMAANRTRVTWVGVASVAAHIPQYVGIALGPVLYFMALNRLAPIFSIIIGYHALKEGEAYRRLPPVLVMLAGAAIIIFGG